MKGDDVRIKRYGVALFITMVLLVGVPAAPAQVSDTDMLQQLRTDIAADRQSGVAANLGLTDAEGQAFWPVYREYRAEMAEVGDRLQKLIQDYADVWEDPTPEQARTMVDEMMAIQKKELKVRDSYLKKFREVLPEVKVARFVQIENKIDAVIKLGLADAIPLARTTE
jgi:polyhydroxyalkanoate synthesis regulator phasin